MEISSVTYGHLFKERIEVTKSREVSKDGRWFLDILEWDTARKEVNERCLKKRLNLIRDRGLEERKKNPK